MISSFIGALKRSLKPRVTAKTAGSIEKTREVWTGAREYYVNAETEAWTVDFWKPGGDFKTLFDRLDTTRVIELACGHGRHSWQMRDLPNHKTLVDFVEQNIEVCRKRFEGYGNIEYVVNNGKDLSAIRDSSATALFCYDAMVHFRHDVVEQYLVEIARVLQPGGLALLHHSNYSGNMDRDFKENPHWRAYMSQEMFNRYAAAAGLAVVEQRTLDWDGSPKLDTLSLLKKS